MKKEDYIEDISDSRLYIFNSENVNSEEKVLKLKKTSGHKKMANYFNSVISSQTFKLDVDKFKYKYLEKPSGDLTRFETGFSFSRTRKYSEALIRLCDKYNFNPIYWFNTIESFVLSSSGVIKKPADIDIPPVSLCMIDDVNFRHNPYVSTFVRKIKNNPHLRKLTNKYYPISIRISPYASETDLRDFVTKFYSEAIKPLQKKYIDKDSLIGKVRTRAMRKIYEYVYENKRLKRQDVSDKVYKEFGIDIDPIIIRTIISRETKRRKQV